MVFLPREQGKRNLAKELVAKALREEGLVVVGWRPVPLRPEALPPSVRERHPHVEQVVAQSPMLAGDELERALLLARRAVGKALIRQPIIRRLDDLYICSLSSRTIVYKGMVTSEVLPEFYPDLQDPAFVSPYAVLHRRFSTNTAPKWSLAQPMRLLAHNGEINTLLGNLAWMRAREPELAAPVWGARIAELLPAVHGDSSDSGALDKLVELLVRSGRTPLEALMMTMPAAYEHEAAGGPGRARAPTRGSPTSTTTTPACRRPGTGRRSSPSPTAATSAPASTATACARRATRAPAPACSRSPPRPAPSTCRARRSSRRAGSAPAR